ncbi:MAG: hypothetical protein WB975_07450, partial [Nitrososphaeraceae archaeon]
KATNKVLYSENEYLYLLNPLLSAIFGKDYPFLINLYPYVSARFFYLKIRESGRFDTSRRLRGPSYGIL